MQTPLGNCFIEYIGRARGAGGSEILERFPFWSSEPSAGYFRSLAHAGIRSFYRADHPHGDQIWVGGALETIFPEAVRVVDQNGREICRWTTADEYREVQGDC